MEKEIVINGHTYVLKEEPSGDSLIKGKWYVISSYRTKYVKNGTYKYQDNTVIRFDGSMQIDIDSTIKIRDATPSEIESHLIAEAQRRGYKKGVTFGNDTFNDTMQSKNYYYTPNLDVLYVDTAKNCKTAIYSNGHWSEIIKEQPIKIGGYEVEFKEGKVEVGCKTISNGDVRSLLFAKSFCYGYDMQLEINGKEMRIFQRGRLLSVLMNEDINKILNKLK